MSPASYRAAPPRVGEHHLTGHGTVSPNRAMWLRSLASSARFRVALTACAGSPTLGRRGRTGRLECLRDQITGSLGCVGVACQVAVLERLLRLGERILGLLEQLLDIGGGGGGLLP